MTFTLNHRNPLPGAVRALALVHPDPKTPVRVEPGLFSFKEIVVRDPSGNLSDNNPHENPDTGTRRYLPITKERKEREEWGMAARVPVPLPRVQYVTF